MRLVMPPILLLFQVCVIGFRFTVQGSAGFSISPAPAVLPPKEVTLAHTESSVRSDVPSSGPQPNGPLPMFAPLPQMGRLTPSPPVIPIASPPLSTAPPPKIGGLIPSSAITPAISPPPLLVIPRVSPPLSTAPPPEIGGLVPSSPITPIISPPPLPVIPIAPPPLSIAPPPLSIAPPPEFRGLTPPSPIIPIVSAPLSTAPPPVIVEGHKSPVAPNITQRKAPVGPVPVSVPVASPLKNFSHGQSPLEPEPFVNPSSPGIPPASGHGRSPPLSGVPKPGSGVPVASPPRNLGWNQPLTHPIAPATPVPIVSPNRELPQSSPVGQPIKQGESPSTLPAPDVSHALTPPNIDWGNNRTPVAAPPYETVRHLPPMNHSPTKGSFSAVSPSTHNAPLPASSSPNKRFPSPGSSPAIPSHKHKGKASSLAPALSPMPSKQQGFSISPAPAVLPPKEVTLAHTESSVRSDVPSSGPQPNGPLPMFAPLPQMGRLTPSPPVIPIASPPLSTAPPPKIGGLIPSSAITPAISPPPLLVIPRVSPPLSTAPPPEIGGLVPSSPITPIISPPPLPVIPIAPPPLSIAPPPEFRGLTPPSPIIPIVSAPLSTAPPPVIVEGHKSPVAPNITQRKAPVGPVPVSVPVASPLKNFSHGQSPLEPEPFVNPSSPGIPPSSGHGRSPPLSVVPKPGSGVPVASPPRNLGWNQPLTHPIAPATPVPIVSPNRELPQSSPVGQPIKPGESPSTLPAPDVSHALTPPNIDWGNNRTPVAAPPYETVRHLPPMNHSPTKGSFSAVSPSTHNAPLPASSSPKSSPNKRFPSPGSSPAIPSHKHKGKASSLAPALSPMPSKQQGPIVPPKNHYAPPPLSPGSEYPIPNPVVNGSPAPSPSSKTTPGWTKMPILPPKASSPFGSSSRGPKLPSPPPILTLPPPPPNEDCSTTICVDPFTNTPPGSPCSCVLPMQVGLQLNVALYTFFPLVSELAQEIAAGVFMKQSQVRIMGANAASQEPEKTIVLLDLVPLGKRFDNTTAFLTSQRFWLKQVAIKALYFGDYEVLYVRYPGLPPSPPSANSGITIIDDGPYSGNNNNARTTKPLGVDVRKGHHKNRLSAGAIVVIALSASTLVVLCSAAAWVFLVRNRGYTSQPKPKPQPLPASSAKPSGTTGSMIGSAMSSVSLSFGSSIAPYTGSAKTFGSADIERATNNFDDSRILGEGGFGRVYSGILEDGTQVAVKVLKRDDHQGGREFLAEVEMLSRLHHRNLVKLIGICAEERNRCLIYELIPNGSVESHLHGVDKDSAPLDWDARIKIALGAARGLAYLHEDSSPRVIHRDFKSSNILLEYDFTPKVSDFGLARTAMDEENRHISTRVMGTFGYVAPEYAMTGHLLVKSDVYSYGVVLLELLSGRKPVDMSQPPGQENLVAWARPLLTSKEGLQTIADPYLGPDVPFDSVAKVAAIASMCVQPEVSHRPFMGEVVQALKLICNECDEAKEVGSRCSSRDLSVDMDVDVDVDRTIAPHYDSEPDIERGLPMSDYIGTSVRYGRRAVGSVRRYSSSGPLTRGRGTQLWKRMRGLTGGSVSEHGAIFRLWPSSD